MNYWLAIIPLIISAISLCFSIRANLRQVPNLKIKILDDHPSACYGATAISKEGTLSSYIAFLRLRIYNQSLTSVTISEILLQKENENYELASNEVDYWKQISFYFDTDDDCPTDGSYLDYENNGVKTPFVLSGYETRDIICVFMHFPKSNKPLIKATLKIDTAVGIKTKKVKLLLYDKEYSYLSFKDFEKYCKSR